MRTLLEFFTETNGRLSSTRLFVFIVIVMFVIDWSINIYRGINFMPSPQTLAVIIASFGLKAGQKAIEEKDKRD